LTLLAIILGAVSANALNIYSSSMSLTSLGLKLPKALSRSVLVIVSGIAGTGGGLGLARRRGALL